MTRWQWLVLAAAVAVLFLSLRDWQSTVAPSSNGSTDAEPDLYMEDAVISQFDAQGNLRYRLSAERIAHFADQRLTDLVAPSLTFERADGAPWVISSARGEVQYAADAASTPTGSLMAASSTDTLTGETVILRDQVRLTHRYGDHFLTVRTDQLQVMPIARTASTADQVLIETDAGRTIAQGMEGQLEAGQLKLFSSPQQRVVTVVLPKVR